LPLLSKFPTTTARTQDCDELIRGAQPH